MKLLVKTLTGGKFEVEAGESSTVAEVKTIIENVKSDLPAAQMKLIKSGKVLKDEDVLSAIGVKENDFLVVMITKAKKAAAAPASAAPAPAAASEAPKTPAPAAEKTTTTAPAPAAPAPTPAASTATTTTPAAPPAPSSSAEFPAEAVTGLTAMGFPEEEVRHCLRAARGNPDLAVEFLTNGIPEGINVGSSAPTPGATSSSSSSSSSQPLQALRNHPQFNDLRRLVQSNPQMLQQVLSQIGQQQPELLQEINANQALFLQMMNEPVTESSSSSAPAPSSSAPAPSGGDASGMLGLGGLDGPGNPAQMAQMIESMSPEELLQMSQMMGLTPEQLRATAQMIGQMPPEQLQQFMGQVMGGAGGAGGMGGGPGGPQVLRLTDEEMAAVDRLTEMGFDRAEAAQAFLACDKDEALAANFLMDSMADGGGFFGGGGGGSNNGGGNNDGNNNNSGNDGNQGGGDGDEDMYD
mmetsp:Transcript_20847/g.48411  ORF Transcript_20847/g.48411 Transcript_20847/m.48411 type:complete len:466 (-) Transcript_20847:211-1608(-)